MGFCISIIGYHSSLKTTQLKMGSNRVFCWNGAGLRAGTGSTKSKMDFLNKEIGDGDFGVLALVETHHRGEDDFPEEIKFHQRTHQLVHSPALAGDSHAGIIVIIANNFEVGDVNEVLPGRLINIKLLNKGDGSGVSLSVFYGPMWRKMNRQGMADVIDELEGLMVGDQNNLLIGDFNFVENDIDRGKDMGKRDKSIASLFETARSNTGMVDPFRVQFPRKKCFSFVSPQGKSRIDRVYVGGENVGSITDMKYVNTPFYGAHKIMRFSLMNGPSIGPGYWKLNSSVVDDKAYVQEVEEALAGIVRLNVVNSGDRWDLIGIVIRGVTRKYTSRKALVKGAVKEFVLRKILDFEQCDRDLSVKEKELYIYYKEKFKQITEDEIEGYRVRTRGQPTYEINEPDISFFARLEKKSQARNSILQLKDESGVLQTENRAMLEVAENYYTKLYTPSMVKRAQQLKLLKNIDKRLGAEDRRKLDAPITHEELLETVLKLLKNKSPGPDGITAEFYKKFWYLLKNHFLEYINDARTLGFNAFRNSSVTTIIYKHKGEIYELDYYRPIALMNVDLKILTKTLATRLNRVLPSVVHRSQTAVQGRRIDYNIHLMRDLIDLIDEEDSQGAFIFLDQEKAFDRVDHGFLFQVLDSFGVGGVFVSWVRALYQNASTRIKVNGFLSNNIPLRRGVRQGCPLSMVLYVLVIEVLALQFRSNQNLVGFRVGGEKIISLHYADDAVVVILQNRCFKEVIKELEAYEEASGAKVNYEKTRGLWCGKWKDRSDKPLGIRWTNGNVKNLGVYFGNDRPDLITFGSIVDEIKRSLDFWKQFRLCVFAKARVIEIFHASRLWFASTFYNVPPDVLVDLQRCFRDFVNFPGKVVTVAEVECQKLREDGGIKLIDIATKCRAYRIMWLIDLIKNEELQLHLALVDRLLGEQKGGLRGADLFFVSGKYAGKILQTNSVFYREAILAMSNVGVKKRVEDINLEKVFFNSTFLTGSGKTLSPNQTCRKLGIFTYGEILAEQDKKERGIPCKGHVANALKHIEHIDREERGDNVFFCTERGEYLSFGEVTHKMLYREMIRYKYKPAAYVAAWGGRLQGVEWKKVWESVGNPVCSELSRSAVWAQIHLNEYTTYSYNKWHKARQVCPLCRSIPGDKFHITLGCPTVIDVWIQLEYCLMQVHPCYLSEEEAAFGLVGRSPGILLRNWLTFLFRQCVVESERIAYKKGANWDETDLILYFNQKVRTEVRKKLIIFSNLGKLEYFESIFAVNDYLLTWENDEWQILTLLPVQ